MAIIHSVSVADVIDISAHHGDIISIGTYGRTRGGEIYVSQSMHLTAAQAREVGVALIAAANALEPVQEETQ